MSQALDENLLSLVCLVSSNLLLSYLIHMQLSQAIQYGLSLTVLF